MFASRVRFSEGERFEFALPMVRRSASSTMTPRTTCTGSAGTSRSVDVFTALCRDADVVFDIGANVGLYAVFAASANRKAVIVAFEPGRRWRTLVRRNLALNDPLTRRVELPRLALGDRDGEAPFYLTGGTSSLSRAFRPYRDRVLVEVVRGDEIVRRREIARVDLIKIDTESTEPAV